MSFFFRRRRVSGISRSHTQITSILCTDLHFSPNGSFLAALSQRGAAYFWNLGSSSNAKTLSASKEVVADDYFTGIAWAPTSGFLAASTYKGAIQIYDPQTAALKHVLRLDDYGTVKAMAWSPDGELLASVALDNMIRFWNPALGTHVKSIDPIPAMNHLAWSPDGAILASSSYGGSIYLWNPRNGILRSELKGHYSRINCLTWSSDSAMIASCSDDGTSRIWSVRNENSLHVLKALGQASMKAAWSPNGRLLATTTQNDSRLQIWDTVSGREAYRVEGHVGAITDLEFSRDGRILASAAANTSGSLRIWRTDTWECAATVSVPIVPTATNHHALAFDPTHQCLAILTEEESQEVKGQFHGGIEYWNLDIDVLAKEKDMDSRYYSNAKVVLVGDTGVGKSGLGLVLSGHAFEPTDSTHGRHVWYLNEDMNPLAENARNKANREILLWDLAGQQGYRVIHQLFLDDTSVALIVIDGRNETDPFGGVHYWERALRQAAAMQNGLFSLTKFLVVARSDRGGVAASQDRINTLVTSLGFQGYFVTSAKEGRGITELKEAISKAIDWTSLPRISSSDLYHRIKQYLVSQKLKDRSLSNSEDLYQSFISSMASSRILSQQANLRAEFQACIGLVEAAGLLKRLSFGSLVLWQPEFIDFYASALINAARVEPDGLGSLEEDSVKSRNFFIPTEGRLRDMHEEQLIMIAMLEDLLRRELILREKTSEGIFLVFPAQLTRDKPEPPMREEKVTINRTAIFEFEGPIANIYASLVVRLSHSEYFKRKELWQNGSTYTTRSGETCGLLLRSVGEGSAELTVYYEEVRDEKGVRVKNITDETRDAFEGYVDAHVRRRAIRGTVNVQKVYSCRKCGLSLSNEQAKVAHEQKWPYMTCPNPQCDGKIYILDHEEVIQVVSQSGMVSGTRIQSMDEAADRSRERAAAAMTIAGKRQLKQFDVFMCHHTSDKPAVKLVANQLLDFGILPWLDEWDIPPGQPWLPAIEHEIERIPAAAVFFGGEETAPWRDLEIQALLRQFVKRRCSVIPVILPTYPKNALAPNLPLFLEGMQWIDLRIEEASQIERLAWGVTSAPNYKDARSPVALG